MHFPALPELEGKLIPMASIKVALVRKLDGTYEWVPANKVRKGEVVMDSVVTTRPPLMAR